MIVNKELGMISPVMSIIVDIDNTIAKMSPERKEFITQQRKDYDSFYKMCFEDEPIGDVINIVGQLHFMGNNVVFCTGRREEVRSITEAWLNRHLPFLNEFTLLMRPNGNRKCDSIVKPKLVEDHGLTPENVLCILEDRNRVVDKWRELGFRCLQVAEGEY